MKIMILGDLTDPSIQKLCQWLSSKDQDLFPIGSMDLDLVKHKMELFDPDILHAFGLFSKISDGLKHPHTVVSETAPKCVDTSMFKSGYSPYYRMFRDTQNTKVVLVIGSISPGKFYDVIVKSIATIKEDYPEINFVFHNPGEDIAYQEEIKELAINLLVSDLIFSNGHVPYVRMPQIYNAADAVIAIPTSESVSSVVLEALACEIPIISTKDNGNNYKLIPPAWCINLGDSYEISDTIVSIFKGSRYTHGRAIVQDSYEQEDVMNLLLSDYEKEILPCE